MMMVVEEEEEGHQTYEQNTHVFLFITVCCVFIVD
jgi:hypothetical protein